MALLSKLFGSGATDDHLDRQAKTLVSAARIFATGSYTQFAQELPITFNISIDDWDFFLTVGGVFIAASGLNQMEVSDAVEDRLMESVARDLESWNADSIRAFEDCKQLFEDTYDTLATQDEYRNDERFLGADAVGLWIAWNLLGHRPDTTDELKLHRFVGVAVTHSFLNWWKPS